MAVDNNRTLYVANLHKDVTEEVLYELFLQAGPVERVSIPATNNNYRYGFVTYLHGCTIDYALQLYKGTSLFKKELTIKRKGEKTNSDQQAIESDRFDENINDIDIMQDQSSNSGYVPHHNTSNELSISNKSNFHSSKLTQNSLKGHWTDHNRPYRHDARRPQFSRKIDSRNWHRSHEYQKSHRYRSGRHSHVNN